MAHVPRLLRAAVARHRIVDRTATDGLLRIRWVDRDIHDRAWEIFERYDHQAFSFCDCSSFVVARDEGVDYVFGFDRDFPTMGLPLRP